jgi:hypothetical protein
MKLVLNTQFMENYGAHDYNPALPVPQYWKHKGGDTYVVADIPTTITAESIKALVAEVSPFIEYANDHTEEYITQWCIADNDEVVVEDWDTPIEMTRGCELLGVDWACSKKYMPMEFDPEAYKGKTITFVPTDDPTRREVAESYICTYVE